MEREEGEEGEKERERERGRGGGGKRDKNCTGYDLPAKSKIRHPVKQCTTCFVSNSE